MTIGFASGLYTASISTSLASGSVRARWSQDWRGPEPSDRESVLAAVRATRRAFPRLALLESIPPSPGRHPKARPALTIAPRNSPAFRVQTASHHIAHDAVPAEIAIRSTISAGLEPPCGRSPPCRTKSGEVCRDRQNGLKSGPVSMMSDTTAIRNHVAPPPL